MTKQETILQMLVDKQLTVEQANIMLGELDKQFRLKLHKSGVVSAYGLARWPINLYPEAWTKLFEHKEDIESFIGQHRKEIEANPAWKKRFTGKPYQDE